MKESQRILLVGLVLLFVITFTSGLVYLIAQQSIRLGANSDPARLAAETAIRLDAGISPKVALPAEKTDITKSLEPFVMVFDSGKNLVATSGMMGDKAPVDPTNKESIFNNILNIYLKLKFPIISLA